MVKEPKDTELEAVIRRNNYLKEDEINKRAVSQLKRRRYESNKPRKV